MVSYCIVVLILVMFRQLVHVLEHMDKTTSRSGFYWLVYIAFIGVIFFAEVYTIYLLLKV